ncbi:MAG: Trk system potassium transporter TrkA [Dehalococcoidales bacterium]
MYIIIAGGGVVGFNIASLLTEEAHEVTVIETSEPALETIRRQLDVKTIRGNAATPRVLKDAEVGRADLILAVTNSDEANMVISFMAKELGAARTAARVRNPDYSGYFQAPAKSPTAPRKIVRPKSMGVDVFINPEVEAAKEVMSILSSFYSTPVEHFAGGLVQIREFKIEGAALVDKKLPEIDFPRPCVVAAIVRAGGLITPGPDVVIQAADSFHLVAHRDDMDELGKVFSPPKRPVKNVAILGGGRVGFLVAEGLAGRGVKVKVIEKDAELARQVAIKLNGPVVLHGDGTDREFLLEQGVPTADAFVATTDSDELNILVALLVKNLGVPRSLIIINKPGYLPLAEAVGIDVAASPSLLTADQIAHFVLSGGAISAALLEGKQLEAVEFVVSPTAHIAGKKVADAGLPKEAVAGALVRNGRIIIPPGNETVKPDDHLIVVSPVTVINDVEKLFK